MSEAAVEQAPVGQQDAAPAPAPVPTSFLDEIQDSAQREWAQNKGWKSAAAVVQSAYNLEKMVGAPADQVVRLPADLSSGEAVRPILAKLGLPEAPDGYELPTPTDMTPDEGFMNWSKEAFHKAGLTKGQATDLVGQWNEYVQGQVQAQQEEQQSRVTAEEQALRKELGQGYDVKMRMAQNAARSLGIQETDIDALEQSIGYARTMRLFMGLGEKLGESQFIGSDGETRGFNSQMTPAAAREAYNRMVADPVKGKALLDRMHPQHKDALAEKTRLFSIMYPEG